MARVMKPGLTYFPLDVDFLNDRKIRKLMRKYGSNAASAMIAVFSSIYKDQGYYMKWDEDICFDLSEVVLMQSTELEAIILDALDNEIFDKNMYTEHGILTSEAIQNQYKLCINRRKMLEIEKQYWIVEEDKCNIEGNKCNKNGNNDNNLPLFADGMQQTKENKTKVKENKEKETPPNLPAETAEKREEEKKKRKEENSVPAYCMNKTTHNYTGLLERLATVGVRDALEVKTILKMSDYGRIGAKVWKVIAYGNWPRGNVIKMPGKYIIAQLSKSE